MGIKGKLIGEVEVSSHGHHAHEHFAMKPHKISDITPSHIQGCELLDGQFDKPGSIVNWSYTLDGKASFAKCVVEKLDEAKKIVVWKVIGGHLLEEYSTFVVTLHATENEVKWTLEYEKLDEEVPHPTKLLDFFFNINKHIDDHHLSA